ncbi:MAG: hypothetical protein AB1458_05115 [Bacteroidota bacterium]
MKRFTFLVFLIPAIASSQNTLKSLGEYRYTVPLRKEMTAAQLQTEWWHEYLEWPVHDRLLKTLLDRIDSGKIPVFIPHYPFDKIATRSEVAQLLHRVDTAYQENYDINTGEPIFDTVLVRSDFYQEDISSLSFFEEWFFNESTMEFKKKVKGFTINRWLETEYGERRGEKAMFFVATDKSFYPGQAPEGPQDVRTVPYLTYYHNTIDHSSYDNNKTILQQSQLSMLLTQVKAAAEKNKSIISDTLFPYTEKPDKKELAGIMAQMGKASNLKFYEEWCFDVGRMQFEKKIRGVVLLDEKTLTDSFGLATVNRREIAFIPLNGFVPENVLGNPVTTVEKQLYTVQTANFHYSAWHTLPRLANADSAKVMAMQVMIADKVKNHKLSAYPGSGTGAWAYDPWDPRMRVPKTKEELEKIFVWYDSVYVEWDMETGQAYKVMRHELQYSDISAVQFYESWNFDLKKLQFGKEVKAIALLLPKIDKYTGECRGFVPVFCVNIAGADAAVLAQLMQPQYLLGQGITTSVPIDFDRINLMDTYDSKTGEVKWITGYGNSWQNNLYASCNYTMVQGIIDGVYSGGIKALDPQTKKAMKKEQVKMKLDALKDSTFVKPGDLSTDYTLVNRLKFTEDWYFNPDTMQFCKKVTAVTLVRAVKVRNEETGADTWKETELFTILLN